MEVLSCAYGISFLDDGSGIGSGTSCSFETCYVNFNSATVNPEIAYNLTGLTYSTMTTCAVDNGTRTDSSVPQMYAFNGCRGITLNGCGCENSSAIVIRAEASGIVVNTFRSIGITGVSAGTSAVVFADNADITLNNCEFESITSAGTTFNWVIQNGSNVVEINPVAQPSGGNSFISYGSSSKRQALVNGVWQNYTGKGTFVPTLAPSTSGSFTLSADDTLYYERFGNVVHIQGWVQIASVSSPVGGFINLSTLPFTPADLTENAGRSAFTVSYAVGAVTTPKSGIVLESNTTARIYVDASTVVANDIFYVQMSYVTND